MSDDITRRKGPIEATISTWSSQWNTTAAEAEAKMRQAHGQVARAEKALTDDLTAVDESRYRRANSYERFVHERGLSHINWAEEQRAAVRKYESNELQHKIDQTTKYAALTLRQKDVVNAKAIYLDAVQAYQALEEYGPGFHALAQERRILELMDLKPSEEQRIAMYERHAPALPKPQQTVALSAPDREELDELVEHRERMAANGLDTDAADAAIKKRRV